MALHLDAHFTLLRWLSPLADATQAPTGIVREEVRFPRPGEQDQSLRAFVYFDPYRNPIGAYLLCPGLHFLGPDDIRMDRFCRVLAKAGFLVLTPFLPDFSSLQVTPRIGPDLSAALDQLLDHPRMPSGRAPGLFSISFGSRATLEVAARPDAKRTVGAAVIFGGYANFYHTVRFALGLEGDQTKKDPLNRPVAFINTIDELDDHAPEDRHQIKEAWIAFVKETWGKEEMKLRENHQPVADRLAAHLPEKLRDFYLAGLGLSDDTREKAEHCMQAVEQKFSSLDPTPFFSQIRVPIILFHGRDDDVIPATQMPALRDALGPHTAVKGYLTGLYAHTQSSPKLWKLIPAMAREVVVMGRMLMALVWAGTRPVR